MTLRTNEIESLADFDAAIGGTGDLNGWFVQSVDLTERGDTLRRVDVTGAVFLGCTFSAGTEASLRARGALLFPTLPDLPFDPYRSDLYDADELYSDGRVGLLDGTPYQRCHDAEVYAWTRRTHLRRRLDSSLAVALHDHAITDALDEATAHTDRDDIIGVMGGHALQRGTGEYRAAAELGARITRAGRTVLTGGGPGAMEAANLGAYLSGQVTGDDELAELLDSVVAELGRHADFHGDLDGWAAAALRVRRRWTPERAGHSIGIPTWFYGHEPPNVFATEIAKYFTNALREGTLLARCRGGIIYLPGAAGTVQEVFQAVTENYYAADVGRIAPLVLVDRQHWTEHLPVWPLLQALGRGRAMGSHIHCVDTVADAVTTLVGVDATTAAADERRAGTAPGRAPAAPGRG